MRPSSFPDLLTFARQAVTIALTRCHERHSPPLRADGGASLSLSTPVLLAVDGTCGNGHDTLFLAQSLARICVPGAFRVLGFDVQREALDRTRARLAAADALAGVVLFEESHAFLAERYSMPVVADRSEGTLVFAAAMYNLGFLPGGDRAVTTEAQSSVASLRAAKRLLAPGGLIAAHAYGGHPGGREELLAVEDCLCALPSEGWIVARYSFCNKERNPETLFLAEKR